MKTARNHPQDEGKDSANRRHAHQSKSPAISWRGPDVINLDYHLSAAWNRNAATINLSTASAMDLRYDLFLGDIVFRIGDVDFSALWGWVPVLDFALSLHGITETLPEAGEGVLEFTESNAALRFVYERGWVKVSANYVRDQIGANISYTDLSRAADTFLQTVLRDLWTMHPELERNP
jgi:hypothetical protein